VLNAALQGACAPSASRDASAPIGLIGAGSLGAAIGLRLLGCQGSLVAWNRSPARLAPLAAAGVQVATTVTALARRATVIVVCLSDADAIRAVLLDGSVDWSRLSHRLVLNTSTIGAEASEALEADFAAAGVDYLDMPVSGGPEGAASGTLAVYVGDVRAHQGIVGRLVSALAGRVIRCKSNQDAQRLKVLNNLCEAINLWGAAEAIALGRQLGLSLDDLQEGLTGGRGDSRYLRVLLEHLRTAPEHVAVSMAIRTKDLQLAERLAGTPGSLPPLARLTKSLFDEAGEALGTFVDQCECLSYLTDGGAEARRVQTAATAGSAAA